MNADAAEPVSGLFRGAGGRWLFRDATGLRSIDVSLADLLGRSLAEARAMIDEAAPTDEPAPAPVFPPVDTQEIWAAGVTYQRSREGRVEEAVDGSIYDRVYGAERPELFFKATAGRVVADGEPVGIRADSEWDAPEPELGVVVNSTGELFGYVVGNDMSSRSIEGANPLYLPQAKVYDRSCALGAVIVPAWLVDGSVRHHPRRDPRRRLRLRRPHIHGSPAPHARGTHPLAVRRVGIPGRSGASHRDRHRAGRRLQPHRGRRRHYRYCRHRTTGQPSDRRGSAHPEAVMNTERPDTATPDTDTDTDTDRYEMVLSAAAAATESLVRTTPEERAGWLDSVAAALEEQAERLVPLAMQESHLGRERLIGELARTVFQLRLFGSVIRTGEYLEATIDHADPSWGMGARPDLRRMQRPIGPVAVFAASNFPFAFSVAGGDTASAIAAGAPVIVKTHPGHPQLSQDTAAVAAISAAGRRRPGRHVRHRRRHRDGPEAGGRRTDCGRLLHRLGAGRPRAVRHRRPAATAHPVLRRAG